jgi:hypothetical protein
MNLANPSGASAFDASSVDAVRARLCRPALLLRQVSGARVSRGTGAVALHHREHATAIAGRSIDRLVVERESNSVPSRHPALPVVGLAWYARRGAMK